MRRATKAYFNTQANTTSPGKVVIMLYDGAISFLEKAKIKIEEKDYAEKGNLITKAIDIINELTSSLNVEKGGDLAQNLTSLYFYCTTTLLQANMKMDIEKIDIVINILGNLKGAFEEILDTPEAVAAEEETSINMRINAQPSRPMPQMNNNDAKPQLSSAKAMNLYAKNTNNFKPMDTGSYPKMEKTVTDTKESSVSSANKSSNTFVKPIAVENNMLLNDPTDAKNTEKMEALKELAEKAKTSKDPSDFNSFKQKSRMYQKYLQS